MWLLDFIADIIGYLIIFIAMIWFKKTDSTVQLHFFNRKGSLIWLLIVLGVILIDFDFTVIN